MLTEKYKGLSKMKLKTRQNFRNKNNKNYAMVCVVLHSIVYLFVPLVREFLAGIHTNIGLTPASAYIQLVFNISRQHELPSLFLFGWADFHLKLTIKKEQKTFCFAK